MNRAKRSEMDKARDQAAQMMRFRVAVNHHIAEQYPGRALDYGLMLEVKRDLRQGRIQ